MPGLVPGIHDLFLDQKKSWMVGTRPTMTIECEARAIVSVHLCLCGENFFLERE
jgi:hypothetical protein